MFFTTPSDRIVGHTHNAGRMIRTICSGFSFIIILIALAPVYAGAQDPGTPVPTPPPGVDVPATPQIADDIETFSTTDGAWKVSITQFEIRNAVSGNVAEGIYVVVFIEVANTSRLADVFPSKALTLIDSQGTEYQRDNSATADLRNQGDYWGNVRDPIEPGETIETAVVFDVPVDATGLTLNGPGWPTLVDVER